jgi:hypothetical protein
MFLDRVRGGCHSEMYKCPFPGTKSGTKSRKKALKNADWENNQRQQSQIRKLWRLLFDKLHDIVKFSPDTVDLMT